MTLKLSRRSVFSLFAIAAIAIVSTLILPKIAKASSPSRSNFAISIKDAIIDFGPNSDRATIKCTLEGPANSTDTNHFFVRVIITDRRDNAVYDTLDQSPTVVR